MIFRRFVDPETLLRKAIGSHWGSWQQLIKRIEEEKAFLFEILYDLDDLARALKDYSFVHDSRHLFVMNTYLLARCAQLLRYEREEKMLFCAGPVLNRVCLLTDVFLPKLESSFARVKQASGELARVVRILEPFGLKVTGVFHSHPGLGVPHPSFDDYHYHAIAERLGYRVIGGIFTNSGYVRFFTHKIDFEVILLGKNVEVVDAQKHIFRLGGLYENKLSC